MASFRRPHCALQRPRLEVGQPCAAYCIPATPHTWGTRLGVNSSPVNSTHVRAEPPSAPKKMQAPFGGRMVPEQPPDELPAAASPPPSPPAPPHPRPPDRQATIAARTARQT